MGLADRRNEMATELRAPIFVIGAHRSGTTLLGSALGHHEDLAYCEEPRHVWSRGRSFRPDDSLTATDATPRVKAFIHRKFARFIESSGKPRLVEKTPSNCLRLPFILEVFPDALFVHIYRDGRAVVHSTDEVVRSRTPEPARVARRLLGTPVWEWPALIPRAWRTLGRRLLGKEMTYWGPQPPGWRQWLRDDPWLTVLAKQWRFTIEPVLAFRSAVAPSQWLDIRYEDLVADPGTCALGIERFGHLPRSSRFEGYLEGACRQDRVNAWRSALDSKSLEELRPVLEPVLNRLGYTW